MYVASEFGLQETILHRVGKKRPMFVLGCMFFFSNLSTPYVCKKIVLFLSNKISARTVVL